MTPIHTRHKRSATTVVATAAAVGVVALPGAGMANACPVAADLETAFCLVEQALDVDPFTVVDKARAVSDRGREFGQQVNDNNRQFYREYLDYPSRTDLVRAFADDQAAGLADDRAAIQAAVDAASEHAARRAEEAKQEAMDRAAKERKRVEERAAETTSDVEEAHEEAEETKEETVEDTSQQVDDQVNYDWKPGKNYVENTREDVEDFVGDVSPVQSPSPSSGGAGGSGTGGTSPSTTLSAIVEDVTDLVDDVVSTLG